MKCKSCDHAVKGFFKCEPDKYVCIGVKEPFVINDINVECTEYPEYRLYKENIEVKTLTLDGDTYSPYVGDDGIYAPTYLGSSIYYQCVVPKELFVEAYNKWIKKSVSDIFVGCDDADDWCED